MHNVASRKEMIRVCSRVTREHAKLRNAVEEIHAFQSDFRLIRPRKIFSNL